MSDVNNSNNIPTDANQTKHIDAKHIDPANKTKSWQMNALTEALGELTLTVSDSLSVGRGSDNDVVLGSKQVSRNHALLSVLNGELYVKDLDSSNGTFINDERIEGNKTKLLKAEDTVAFASFAFEVAPRSTVTEPTLAAPSVEPSALDPVPLSTEHASHETGTAQSAPVLSNTSAQQNDVVTPEAVANPVDNKTALIDTEVLGAEVIDADIVDDKTSSVDTPTVENVVSSDDLSSEHSMSSAAETQDNNIVKETMVDEVLTATPAAHTDHDNQVNAHETVGSISAIDAPVTQESSATESGKSKPTVIESAISEPRINENVTNETITNEPVMSEPIIDKSERNDSAVKEPVLQSEPVMAAEHDKTTTTALQEEADPDILRAKQAATAQFSGTANLGESRDVGTQGNNAMDQALNNPATNADTAQSHKKPSGSWFIWVFVALIIIGIALWLFNGGGV